MTTIEVLQRTAEITGVSIQELQCELRKQPINTARQLYMVAAVRVGAGTKAEIGAAVNRDHATVIHACKTITNAIDCNDVIPFDRHQPPRNVADVLREITVEPALLDEMGFQVKLFSCHDLKYSVYSRQINDLLTAEITLGDDAPKGELVCDGTCVGRFDPARVGQVLGLIW